MSDDIEWNEEVKQELCETIREIVLGEVRLSHSDPDDIIETCREVYIVEDSPESEWSGLVEYARAELRNAEEALELDKKTWPKETDCDRLDRVEAALREKGILLWQLSPCCDSCSGGELPDRIDDVDERFPGFRDRVRGYSFFIDQNMPEMVAQNTVVSIYLAYGAFSDDDSDVPPEVYEKNALSIAKEVSECLSEFGFKVDWDGSFSSKVGFTMDWKRRELLR